MVGARTHDISRAIPDLESERLLVPGTIFTVLELKIETVVSDGCSQEIHVLTLGPES